jgi:hypothetical protein
VLFLLLLFCVLVCESVCALSGGEQEEEEEEKHIKLNSFCPTEKWVMCEVHFGKAHEALLLPLLSVHECGLFAAAAACTSRSGINKM